MLKKIGQHGGAGRWRFCYQRGLPRIVFTKMNITCKKKKKEMKKPSVQILFASVLVQSSASSAIP